MASRTGALESHSARRAVRRDDVPLTLAIVTGTTSGIGLHTAIGLARRGISVIATVRDTERAQTRRAACGGAGLGHRRGHPTR